MQFRLDHIGVACANPGEVANLVRSLYTVSSDTRLFDEHQRAELRMLRGTDGMGIELVSGVGVQSFAKRGVTYYHIAFEVGDLELALNQLLQRPAVLASPPAQAPLFQGRRVAFVYTALGLIELIESAA